VSPPALMARDGRRQALLEMLFWGFWLWILGLGLKEARAQIAGEAEVRKWARAEHGGGLSCGWLRIEALWRVLVQDAFVL
jgi:hypothetical protein